MPFGLRLEDSSKKLDCLRDKHTYFNFKALESFAFYAVVPSSGNTNAP